MRGIEVELSIIGNEGMVGERAILGGGASLVRTHVQLAGIAWVLPAEVMRVELRHGGVLADLLLRQIEARLTETSQMAMCNHLHSIEQRLGRWILTLSDRSHREALHVTQEQMARGLGAARPGVSITANKLREAGLIDYKRACISILDRQGLEENACECHQAIKDAVLFSLPAK